MLAIVENEAFYTIFGEDLDRVSWSNADSNYKFTYTRCKIVLWEIQSSLHAPSVVSTQSKWDSYY